jgi:hypothetical protein
LYTLALYESLIALLIHNNIIYYSFQGFLQLKNSFSFTLLDKVSLFGAVFFIFATLFSSLTFLILINYFQPINL